jgi:hypothetical protein
MEVIAQRLTDIVDSLQPLTVDWKDDIANRVILRLTKFPIKKAYTIEDVRGLLDENFDDAILIFRLFLGLSKDQFVSILRGIRDEKGIGVKSYRAGPESFIDDLLSTGLLEAMAEEANRKPHWSNTLVERHLRPETRARC